MSTARNSARRALFPVLAVLLAVLAVAGGCGKSARYQGDNLGYEMSDALLNWRPTTSRIFNEDETPLGRLNSRAADALADGIDTAEFPPGSRLHVRPLLRVGQTDGEEVFGRLVADQLASRLSTYGYPLTAAPPAATDEAKADFLADRITYDENVREREEALKKAGTFERKPDEVPPPHRSAILSGDYILGRDVIYLTARVTRIDDQTIIAGHSWTLPNNQNTRKLLPDLRTQGGGMTPSIETSLSGAPATTFNEP